MKRARHSRGGRCYNSVKTVMNHKKISEIVNVFLLSVSSILNIALVAVLFFLVLSRYFFEWSILGLYDVALFIAVWLYCLGGTLSSFRNEHLKVNLLELSINNKTFRKCQRVFVVVVTFVTTSVFLYFSYEMFGWAIKRPQIIPSLGVPLWIAQLAILAGAFGCFSCALRDLINLFKSSVQNNK